jgi:NAD(P)-dependent dehydrogenase (short-subunit alcohol dehydrogenase family)
MRAYSDLASLKGRVALVAGGAGALGRAVTGTFAELGAAVALVDKAGSGGEEIARALTDKYGVLATCLAVDLADEVAVRKVPQRVVDSCGRLDILVTISKGEDAALDQLSAEAWRAGVATNLTAPFLLVQQALPALRASGRGSVINLGADGPGAGLVQMTQWLATSIAPHVRVNAIAARNLAREEEVKGAAAFFASDLSVGITGQCISIGGGV